MPVRVPMQGVPCLHDDYYQYVRPESSVSRDKGNTLQIHINPCYVPPSLIDLETVRDVVSYTDQQTAMPLQPAFHRLGGAFRMERDMSITETGMHILPIADFRFLHPSGITYMILSILHRHSVREPWITVQGGHTNNVWQSQHARR